MRGTRGAWGLAALVLALVAMPGSAGAATTPTRYSLAHGCYSLSGVAAAQQVRMQPTALGRYLLYRPDRTFAASQKDGSVAAATDPSPAADWKVDEAGGGAFTLTPQSGGHALTGVRFEPASGCAVFPEADLDATGTPAKGATAFEKVGGLVEGHMHWMTFEYLGGKFHCGKPWDPYGIQYALPDCSSIEGPQGAAAPTQNTLNYGAPEKPHDTSGYPKLTAWGGSNLTYEGTYWKWIERSWLGGLRLMVMGINENRALCLLQANRQTNCNEMDTVRRGLKDMYDLQDYVDAQAGGPGKGFFQIVKNPYEARRVINEGKMAVVLEIEVSEPFDCIGWDKPSCDTAQIDRELDEMHRAGVRSSLLLNKFDNPLVGVRFDSGPIGVLINGGNHLSSGTWWDARTCTGPLSDNTIFTPEANTSAGFASLLTAAGVPGGTAPAYPPAPHCNTRGLTDLGRHVVKRMMDLHMVVNPDHMSQAGVDDTLTLLESRHYSGVISPHGWMDPGNWPRLWKLGGVAFPGHSAAPDYVKEWQKYRPKETPYDFGWGYGADLGGLSQQPEPDAEGKGGITYPFKSYDGSVTFQRERTGDRTFDYNKEGVAQYGLYADWFNDLRRLGGEQLAKDMWDGAEAYLEMWERADGVPSRGCASGHGVVGPEGLGRLRLGDGWETLLRRAGQPQERTTVWSWCVQGAKNRSAADVAVLSRSGKVQLVGSTAQGRSARGIGVGAKRARVVRGTRAVGGGIRVRPSSQGTLVYALRSGRVAAVAVASSRLARSKNGLRAAVGQLLAAKATAVSRKYVPGDAQARADATGQPVTGQALAGTTNPRLNAALQMLCSAQVQHVGAAAGLLGR